MPIPSYPENRREEYLNNIATGSGEIPPYPENREEQYLDAIAKNGGGGSGGGVLVVHDVEGTLDKTWQEIVDADLAVILINNNRGNYKLFVSYSFDSQDTYVIGGIWEDDNGYIAYRYYVVSSANDYPVVYNGGGSES